MPVHDWTRVDAGIFHDLHVAWIPEIKKVLNSGLLPQGYYALAEQHAGQMIADVITLHTNPAPEVTLASEAASGGTAVAEAAPKVRRHFKLADSLLHRRRTLAIRHISGHRLVALIEVMSPSNKDRAASLDEFVGKILSALEYKIHVLVIDLLPPGSIDPCGIHGALEQAIHRPDEPYDLPPGEPLTLASYAANGSVDAYLEHVAVGAALPEMPLFLTPERYVNVPLESTYQAAYAGMPSFWRDVLESSSS